MVDPIDDKICIGDERDRTVAADQRSGYITGNLVWTNQGLLAAAFGTGQRNVNALIDRYHTSV